MSCEDFTTVDNESYEHDKIINFGIDNLRDANVKEDRTHNLDRSEASSTTDVLINSGQKEGLSAEDTDIKCIIKEELLD